MIRLAHRTYWALLVLLATRGGLGEVSRVEGQVPGSTVTVRGWVVEHESGAGLEGATVLLEPVSGSLSGVGAQISGAGGVFVFGAVPPGTYRLSASLLGYTELSDTLLMEPDADLELTLPLSVSPLRLEPIVVVVDRRPIGPLRGFERRRVSHRGTFLTRQDIDASNAPEFTDLLRTIPGVRLVPTATYGYEVFFRGGCTPDLWLDGARVGTTTDMDSFLRPEDLEAVEVYRGPDLPGEFGTNLCGAIVAWTRRAEQAPGERSLRKQLILAGSFVLLAVLLRR